MLVNCSGLGLAGKFDRQEEEMLDQMVKVNCLALTRITRAVLPYMPRKARIVQVASSAAFVPQPGFAVYAATKSYVLNLSLALRQELKKRGIIVTAVCPGPVKTEFFDTAYQKKEMKLYKKLAMAKPEKVVKKALRDVKRPGGLCLRAFHEGGESFVQAAAERSDRQTDRLEGNPNERNQNLRPGRRTAAGQTAGKISE